MGATWASRMAVLLAVGGLTSVSKGAGPPAEAPRVSGTAEPASAPATKPAPSPATPPVAPSDVAKARADAEGRLKMLGDAKQKGAALPLKGLRELLEQRLELLKQWDDVAKVRHDAEHPEPDPVRQAAEAKLDAERIRESLDQFAKNPHGQLPASFRGLSTATAVTERLLGEIKESIDNAQGDLKDWTEKLEKLKTDASSQPGSALAKLRADRDKVHQGIATLKAARPDREAAVTSAKTPADRAIALERLVNEQWKLRVEEERLAGLEARLVLEGRLTDLAAVQLQAADGHVRYEKKRLDLMQSQYRALSERREQALKKAADDQEKRAAKANNPLERFRAGRAAALLELEALITKSENEWTSSPIFSLEEMKKLADDADNDFANIKKLLDDGRVSHLDALRLTNDFRRIGPERERLVRNELAKATNQVTVYENALSGVELALVSDSRDDHFELENLLERLAARDHDPAMRVFNELETKHAKLLNHHRDVLVKLATRAEETHEQILRRIKTLDEQYNFIRTHLILVRDREPIGMTTAVQAEREVTRLGKALVRLVLETGDRSLWGRVSGEFVAGMAFLVILPWPLVRARRLLARAHRA